MSKNQSAGSARRSGTARDRSSLSGKLVDRNDADKKPLRGTRREILFPTEPTSIPHEQIDRAIDAVMARKK